jgi:hypothetical protein
VKESTERRLAFIRRRPGFRIQRFHRLPLFQAPI